MESRNCPDCGSPLSVDALEGMCPSCLAGLLSFDATAPEGAGAPALNAKTNSFDGKLGATQSGQTTVDPAVADPELGASAPPANPQPAAPKAHSHRFGPGAVRGTPLNVQLDVPGHIVTAEIARGGMGIVYRATQLEPRREVALKMLLSSQVGIQHLRDHFLLEARAIARLDHPNILPIYHLGEHEGIPFFTMKLATHGSLHHRRARYRSQWTTIAEHMAILADAVSYAHQRGVLHRDLKPSNVLFDESNRPYVTDFGLARVSEKGVQAVSEGTHLVGTPRYMSPEVIEGGADGATTGSDVYGLGLIFYELLAQRGPLEAGNEHEHMRRMLSEPIPRPSSFLSGVPADLELLCLRCLEHDRLKRMPSAALLRDELRLWLQGKPLHLRELGWWDRWRVWAQRHKLLTASMMVGGLGSAVAVTAATLAVLGLLHSKTIQLQTEDRSTEDLIASRLGAAQRLRYEGRIGQRGAILGLLREAGAVRSTAALRSEAVRLLTRPSVGEEISRHSLGFEVSQVVATADLDLLAIAGSSGDLRVWRRSTTKQLWQEQVSPALAPAVLEFSSRGRWLAAGPDPEKVTVYDAVRGGRVRAVSGTWLGFSTDELAVMTWQQGEVRRRTIASGEASSGTRFASSSEGLAAVPVLARDSGSLGIILPYNDRLELFSGDATLALRIPWAGSPPTAMLWEENLAIIGDTDGLIRVWSVPEATPRVLSGHSAAVRRLWLEPGTRRLWSTTAQGEALWWDLTAGTLIGRAPGWQPVRTSTDARQLLAVNDRVISLLSIVPEAGRRGLELPTPLSVRHVEFSPGNVWLLTVQSESMAVWDVATARLAAQVACHGAQSAHFGPSGARLALVESNQVRWFQLASTTNGNALKEYGTPLALGPSPGRGGRASARHGSVLLMDGRNGLLALDIERAGSTNLLSDLRPDMEVASDESRTLAVSSRSRGTTVFVRGLGRTLFTDADRWGPSVFSPDGQYLLQPGPGEHRLLEVATGRVKWTAPADPGVAGSGLGVWPAAGQYLAAATHDGVIRLLHPETGYGIVDLSPGGTLASLAVTADGKLMAAGTEKGSVSVWNLPSIESSLKTVGLDLPIWKATEP